MNNHNKIPKDFIFMYFVQNAVFIFESHFNTNQDDIPAKTDLI